MKDCTELSVKFAAKWKDAAYWPPALALSWIMFGGDWEQIAIFLENGSDMPSDGLRLGTISSFCLDQKQAIVCENASDVLMQGLRAGAPTGILACGRLAGHGALVEIGAAEFIDMEWSMSNLPAETCFIKQGAVLVGTGGVRYSNVLIDAGSLARAHPAALGFPSDASPPLGVNKLILEIAAEVSVPGIRAAERNKRIREALRLRGVDTRSDSSIKKALKGSNYIGSRKRKAQTQS